MTSTLRFILLTAVRDRLFVAMAVAIVILTLLSAFFADQSVTESGAAAASFAGFAIRLVVIGGLVMFVALHVRRGFDNKDLLLILSRPISRHGVILAYWLGFMAVASLLVLLAGLALFAATGPNTAGLGLWLASLWLETAIMTAFTLFFALTLSGVVAIALGAFAFYLLARTIGILLAIAGSEFRSFSDAASQGAEDVTEWIALILPRLDLFGDSAWLVYGPGEGGGERLALLGLQAVLYTGLILIAAMHDFERKRI